MSNVVIIWLAERGLQCSNVAAVAAFTRKTLDVSLERQATLPSAEENDTCCVISTIQSYAPRTRVFRDFHWADHTNPSKCIISSSDNEKLNCP